MYEAIFQILMTVAVVTIVISLLRAKKPATAEVRIDDDEEYIEVRRK